MVKEVLLQKEE